MYNYDVWTYKTLSLFCLFFVLLLFCVVMEGAGEAKEVVKHEDEPPETRKGTYLLVSLTVKWTVLPKLHIDYLSTIVHHFFVCLFIYIHFFGRFFLLCLILAVLAVTTGTGVCGVSKGNMFHTFDGALYTFHGNCTYYLAEDCKNEHDTATFNVKIDIVDGKFKAVIYR